jgi:hypothetical protein
MGPRGGGKRADGGERVNCRSLGKLERQVGREGRERTWAEAEARIEATRRLGAPEGAQAADLVSTFDGFRVSALLQKVVVLLPRHIAGIIS